VTSGTPDRGESQLSPTEELLMVAALAMVVGSVVTVTIWHRALDWAVAHQVLLPASASPLITMPAGDGVGLDARRLAIAVAAVVFLIVCGVASLRRYFAAGGRAPL
jgi:hypothetical protein